MLSKRDLQFVRLAVRWRWVSAEEGEDCLFLKRKFGEKLTIEAIVRRRGYLDPEEIREVAAAADKVGGRRARPAQRKTSFAGAQAPHERPAPKATPQQIPKPPSARVAAETQERSPPPPMLPPSVLREQSAVVPEPPEEIFDVGVLQEPQLPVPVADSPPDEHTRLEPVPVFQEPERPTLDAVPVIEPEEPRDSATRVADMSEILRALDEKERGVPSSPEVASGGAERASGFRYDPVEIVEPVEPPITVTPVAPSVEAERRASVLPSTPMEPGPSDIGDSFEEVSPFDRVLVTEAPTFDPVEPAHSPVDDQLLQLAVTPQEPQGSARTPTVDSMPGESLAQVILEGVESDEASTLDGIDRDQLFVVGEQEELSGTFGQFQIQRLIARGSMSMVYLAETDKGAPVALKVLSWDSEHAANFLSERGDVLLAAARAGSPYIVHTLDVGDAEGRYFVAIEYVEGWTLQEKIDSDERPNLVQMLEIAREVAQGLQAVADQGAVHGDVRPDNILIADDDTAKLAGFGFAPIYQAGAAALTGDGGAIVGTPGYMAPEQALGHAVDTRSDLYALGATMYRVFANRPIFSAIDDATLVAQTIGDPPPDLRQVAPQIPEAVAQIVTRLLAKRPSDRYTLPALLEALEQVLFDLEAEGFDAEEAGSPPPAIKPILGRAALVGAGLVGTATVAGIVLRASSFRLASVALNGAALGALGLCIALMLLSAVALIRRGQIPLPMSSEWLVGIQEGIGAAGSVFLVAGFIIAPPAILNLLVSSVSILVLISCIFGMLLRQTIANARPDRGVGRVLAVLSDPLLADWRLIHVPLLAMLTSLATARVALLAYFSASS